MSPLYPQIAAMMMDLTVIIGITVFVWRFGFASGRVAEAQKTNADALKETAHAAAQIAETVKEFVSRQQEVNERLESMQQLFGSRLTDVERGIHDRP